MSVSLNVRFKVNTVEPRDLDMNRIDDRPIPESGHEIRAFISIKDEEARVPFMIQHHRDRGVDRFFFADNNSSDGTVDYLLSQPDCHVWSAPGSYSRTNFGVDWTNLLIEWYANPNRNWCLHVDTDELLVYPEYEKLDLHKFCDYLDRTNAKCVPSFTLDMYSREPIAEAHYVPGTSFLDVCPYFDSAHHFRKRPFDSLLPRWPTFEISGGPRLRRFYPRYNSVDTSPYGTAYWTAQKLLRRVRFSKVGKALQMNKTELGVLPSQLTKCPLMKGGEGSYFLTNHVPVKLPVSDVTSVLLHFKLFSDFHFRATKAKEEGEHWDSASEYARYDAALRKEPNLTMYYEGSVKFSGSRQLVDLGLMTASSRYDEFVRSCGA